MMLRYPVMAVVALLSYASGSPEGLLVDPAVVYIPSAAAASPRANVVNAITVTNKSGTAIRRYPLQFGRPFLDGAIPHAPAVLLNGSPVPSQADVKNRYPDGSVEFAVIAVVIPEMRPGAPQVLSFRDTAANSNAPLTQAQMLDPSYNFDATMRLVGGTPASGAKLTGNTIAAAHQTVAFWNAITNGGFTISVNGKPEVVTGVNFATATLATLGSVLQTAIAAVIPGATLTNALPWQTVLTVPGTARLSYASPPPSGQDLSAVLNWTQATALSLTPATTGASVRATADARTMLQNGDYKLWTSGPVAQTIILGDDSPARKYDIGFGDGFHPFRPRFYATFWPQTHQVFVRAVGENDLTTELEDLRYTLTITGGQASPVTEATEDLTGDQTIHPKLDWTMSTWTKSFWLGGTPNPQVDIDNNLAYLDSTRWVPNYDPSVTLSAAALNYEYTGYYTNIPHDMYDGVWDGGAWTNGMGTTGARQDLGPEPTWDAMWLYGGDWRMRQLSLTMADIAAAWPTNTRETDPSKRLNRADPVPTGGQTGSGYGLPFATTDRKTIGPTGVQGCGTVLYGYGAVPSDLFKVVGAVNTNQPWCDVEGSHEPGPFFIPYVLTGDPFYLQELENWANYDAAESIGGPNGGVNGRGPTGDEGGASNQVRGDGWILRSRAEAAFAAPDCVSSAAGPGDATAAGSCDGSPGDSDPEKTYLTILTQEDIARWEGAKGVADPVLSGTAEYQWAQQTGDPESASLFGTPPAAPPTGIAWGANVYDAAQIGGYVAAGAWTDSTISAVDDVWMHNYTVYSIGRATELGFAAKPLLTATGQFLTGMINAGYPYLIASYILPVAKGSTFLTTWAQVAGEMSSDYLTGTNPSDPEIAALSGQGPLPLTFKGMLTSQGYDAYASAALATLVDAGVPGAVQAEAWMQANVYQPLLTGGSLAADPSWAIVPRTDTNTLPAQPTH